ncbi:uncharacterized protein K452DRAFT_33605 [Aplosporella prunicola CBS 121167]|uniref:Zinc finger C2H2 LYAR-type domain-containing protein n=1 Tax=Aplosporella prunicola CBS 121167 TaxID=1176127 RepID=A0A6A6BC12_9PEZI|nr:uncharacterized protein K452DRAFT_33605 [Aplosporella prunicola CBS 121167]KAF2141772.1 hypothetical protein K452DRAFT_33605 [Aplosporella prunicola CBS 121167]
MVSFSCEGCGDILTKKKLDPHRNQCWGASYTCIDCMVHFQGTDYRSHTSCMSEAQKYQGALYREKKPKGQQQQQQRKNNNNNSQALVPRNDAAQDTDTGAVAVAVVDVPPRAPTPPAPVNVFDFLVTEDTPNASKISVAEAQAADPTTPASKEGKKDKDASGKKSDKKRKRQQVEDVDGPAAAKAQEEQDAMMVDAPPVLHSGLTDGVDKLLPPGQEYAEGGVEGSPSGPAKRTKQSKSSSKKEEKKSSKERKARGEKDAEKEKKRSRELVKIRRRRSSSTDSHERERKSSKPLKSIGYRAENGDAGALVLHKRPASRAELLLTYLAKDAASEHGVSFHKALKKYHRERHERGLDDLSKPDDEKELWKSIRLRKNDRGEIVLFTE